ncbi:hypothetical protein ACFQND_23225 [Polaromonas aquatica]|uniref:Uncharacterized protein n=1 Tax=Polaromonas aquatica TaxID=332657 RepID=A0ABW1U398_9BURK
MPNYLASSSVFTPYAPVKFHTVNLMERLMQETQIFPLNLKANQRTVDQVFHLISQVILRMLMVTHEYKNDN